MTDQQWIRIQQIVRDYKPSGITSENFESLPDSVATTPEPATDKQINYLKVLRYTGSTAGFSKQEACKLIGDLLQGVE